MSDQSKSIDEVHLYRVDHGGEFFAFAARSEEEARQLYERNWAQGYDCPASEEGDVDVEQYPDDLAITVRCEDVEPGESDKVTKTALEWAREHVARTWHKDNEHVEVFSSVS